MGIGRGLRTTMILGLGLVFSLGALGCAAEFDVSPGATTASVQETAPIASVHAALDPYGTWISVAGYGEVWQPNVAVVGADFVPYASAGGWVSTDAGWVFESDYAWGWAPFHYGHWFREARAGWVWVPGTTWTPAAVEWRTGGGLVGWAPSPPPGVELREEHFTFVETAHLTTHDVVKVALPEIRRTAAFRATVRMPVEVRAGVTVAASGPRVEEIEAASGHRIEARHVEVPRAGLVAEVHAREVARAQVTAPREEHAKAAPTKAREERQEAVEADARARTFEDTSRAQQHAAAADEERARREAQEAAQNGAIARHEEQVAEKRRADAARIERARKAARHPGFNAGKGGR